MAEIDYIERRKLWDEVVKSKTNNPHLNEIQRQAHIHEHRTFQRMIIEQPAADVEEVRHGEWIDLNITEWQCSKCNYRVERWNNTPYCPNCGAKMDGKKEE